MFASSNDSVFVHLNFVRHPESDNFITHADDEPWKIFNITVGPFEINILKSSIFASGAYVLLHCGKRTANGSINAVTRDDDASFKPKAFAHRSLPQTNCFWIVNGGKCIEKDDFGGIDTENVSGRGAMNGGIRFPLFTEVFCASVVNVFDLGKYRENIAK